MRIDRLTPDPDDTDVSDSTPALSTVISGVDWDRVQNLFHRASELPAASRSDYLDSVETDDPRIVTEVRSLLEAHDTEGVLDLALPDPQELADAARIGMKVGPYRIIDTLGRGGMGVVYLAERADDQFNRRVALKVVRPDRAHALTFRFLKEREILARLSHPNIARLYDGGLTKNGTPWFAMELVDGEEVERFCDARALDVEERLELFATICDAVQYAHQNLVVHRDLKPGNVLVDVTGQPKLLDFGIAKLLERDADVTAPMHQQLTPRFAAPEQITGEPITTATDTYTLGVLLYRLLTGRHPYDTAGSFAGAARAILEVEPDRPSAVVQGRSGPGGGFATRTPGSGKRMRGDIDTIVLKALRKEPERRYATAGDLAADIRRHLAERPVTARPDTARYRASRFVRRHRVAVAGAGVTFATILAGAIGMGWQANQAREQALIAGEERDRARLEASRSEATVDFMLGLFAAADPRESLGREITVRELVDTGATGLMDGDELRDQPLVRASMLDMVGKVYDRMNRFDEARPLLEQAVDLRREHLPPDAEELAESLNNLAVMLLNSGDLDAAEPLLEEALVIRKGLPDAAEQVASTLNNLAAIPYFKGDYGTAEVRIREAIAVRRAAGDDGPDLATNLDGLAGILRNQGRLAEADSLFTEALAIKRKHLDPAHPDLAHSYNNLAGLRLREGDAAGAETAYREALEVFRRVEPEHSLVGTVLSNLGSSLESQGRRDEAERAYVESLELRRRIFGSDNEDIAISLNNLGLLYAREGRFDDARPLLEESLAMRQRIFGEEHPSVASAYHNLGFLEVELGNRDEAARLYRRALSIRRVTLGETHSRTRESQEALEKLDAG